MFEGLLAVEFLLQYRSRLPCRAADNFVKGPNDVNFYMCASKQEDT